MRLPTAVLFCALAPLPALAMGNFPEAGACPPDKPWYAICSHSLHKLEGWFSRECRASREAAEADAERHARKWHDGNMRWTGVTKAR